MTTADVVVVGAGIAGLSAAAVLAESCSVVVVEAEATPAHHASGRSAALYIPTYGPPTIRRLTAASREWFESRAHGDADTNLINHRLVMYAACEQDLPNLDELVRSMGDAGGVLHPLSPSETIQLCPVLKREWVAAGGVDRDAFDMDVAAILQVFRAQLRRAEGTIATDHRVTGLDRVGDSWHIETTAGNLYAGVVVNAAGAWVDHVAKLAGLPPLGFVPKRRSIGISPISDNLDIGSTFVADAGWRFYFGAEPGGLLFSPADETPSPPCDARPEEIDLALAIDAINDATTLGLRSVSASWAGLRTFSPDDSIVIGPDPDEPTFVWCGGQGGYGIHTAPAAAKATAAATLGSDLPAELHAAGITPVDLGPERFL